MRIARTTFLYLAVFGIFSFLDGMTVSGQPVSDYLPVIELMDRWEYHWGDIPRNSDGEFIWDQSAENGRNWQAKNDPNDVPGRGVNNYLWLRYELPSGSWRDPTIYIGCAIRFFEVYLDEKLIYKAENLKGDPIKKYEGHIHPGATRFCGAPWHVIPLRQDFQGKTVYFRIYSSVHLLGIVGKVLLGSRADIYRRIIKQDLSRLIIGIISLLLGLSSLILFLGYYRLKLKGFLSFGLFALLIGLFIISKSYTKQLIIDFHPFWIVLWSFAVAFIPVGLLTFVENTFGKGYRSIIRRVWQIHIAITVILFALGMIFPDQMFFIYYMSGRVLVLIHIIIITIAVSFPAVRGQTDARIFLSGFCIFILFTSYETATSLGLVPSMGSLTYIGMFFLLITMALILMRNLVELYNNVKHYSKRLELMSEEKSKITSELHDGIGGIMTNINFLVEIAKGNPTGEKLETALSRISSLSKDGLSEIRSFMRSFDGKETSFDSLVADFRLYGSETMEPHSFEFNMTAKNELGGSRPTASFYLNIFRIYKESLVNILKHSNASKVDVRLNITENVTELIIQDDGAGLKPSAHQGRGILNMKSRAEEMDGRLNITSKNGTRVHFTISTPLIPLSS